MRAILTRSRFILRPWLAVQVFDSVPGLFLNYASAWNSSRASVLYADFFPGASMPIEKLLARAVYEFNHFRLSHKLQYKSPVQFRIEQGFL